MMILLLLLLLLAVAAMVVVVVVVVDVRVTLKTLKVTRTSLSRTGRR